MVIRELLLSDYDALLTLWAREDRIVIREADSRESIGRYLHRNPGLCFVAEKGSKIIGAILCGHDGRRGYIHHLTVSPRDRRSGIGSALVAQSVRALKDQAIIKSHIHVFANNAQAKKFWARLGWRQREELDLYSFINGEEENA